MRRGFLAILLPAVLGLASTACADPVSWDVTGQNIFGTLDLTNGNFTGIKSFGFQSAGLAESGEDLYTAVEGGTQLYRVNTATGALSTVGNASLSYFAFGSTTGGLYMVDTVGTLWSINPTTGASAIVGSTHLNLTGVQSIALSNGNGTLYLALNNNLYTINTTTGSASYVGTSGSTDFGALVAIGGRVYASTVVAPNSVYLFNPVTGVSSFVSLSNAGDYSWGLAPIVPEPGSFGLLAVALAVGGGVLWRRRAVA